MYRQQPSCHNCGRFESIYFLSISRRSDARFVSTWCLGFSSISSFKEALEVATACSRSTGFCSQELTTVTLASGRQRLWQTLRRFSLHRSLGSVSLFNALTKSNDPSSDTIWCSSFVSLQ